MLTRPHELMFPALLISITVLAFNLLGDGLRDALDARMRVQSNDHAPVIYFSTSEVANPIETASCLTLATGREPTRRFSNLRRRGAGGAWCQL